MMDENLSSTKKSVLRISLIKLDRTQKRNNAGGVEGWELMPPKIGQRYMVQMNDQLILKTSPVQGVRRASEALLIETKNSLYRIEYFTEPPPPENL
jgi:hypothetical protein